MPPSTVPWLRIVITWFHRLPALCLGMGGKREIGLHALMYLCGGLLAALHVFSESFHVLRQFIETLLHGFVVSTVITNNPASTNGFAALIESEAI
jgi:hypothetical protein